MKKSKILMLLALTSATYMQQASVSRMGRSAASVARPIVMRGLGSSGQYLAPTAVAATGAFSPGGAQSRNYLTKSWFSEIDDKIDKLEAKVDAEYDILADQHDNITEDSKKLEALREKRVEARGLQNTYDKAHQSVLDAHDEIAKNNQRGGMQIGGVHLKDKGSKITLPSERNSFQKTTDIKSFMATSPYDRARHDRQKLSDSNENLVNYLIKEFPKKSLADIKWYVYHEASVDNNSSLVRDKVNDYNESIPPIGDILRWSEELNESALDEDGNVIEID